MILDRYVTSGCVYATLDGLCAYCFDKLSNEGEDDLPQPDIVFFLCVPYKTLRSRIQQRTAEGLDKDAYERVDNSQHGSTLFDIELSRTNNGISVNNTRYDAAEYIVQFLIHRFFI